MRVLEWCVRVGLDVLMRGLTVEEKDYVRELEEVVSC